MIVFGLVALSFSPGIFLLWLFYKKDTLEPEPKSMVIKVFVFGMIAVIPAGLVEHLAGAWIRIPGLSTGVLILVVLAPVVEELAKFLTVRLTIYRNAEFDEPMDGIVYGAACALGFASVENALYLGRAYFSPEGLPIPSSWAEVTVTVGMVYIVRALLAVPGHALWSSIWGYALGRAKFISNPSAARRLVLIGLALSIFFHGLHNFLSINSATFGLTGLFILSFLMWRLVNKNVRTALVESPFNPESGSAIPPDAPPENAGNPDPPADI